MLPFAPAKGVTVTSGASATPRKALPVAAVASSVGVPDKVPLYPELSVNVTSSPPPAAPFPPFRVAYNVTVVPITTAVSPRYASMAKPAVPLHVHVPATSENLWIPPPVVVLPVPADVVSSAT